MKQSFSLPELLFVAGTRAVLAAGAALLVANRLSRRERRTLGRVLFSIGLVTTIPAALMVFGTPRPLTPKPPRRKP